MKVKAGQSSEVLLDVSEKRLIEKFRDLCLTLRSHSHGKLKTESDVAYIAAENLLNTITSPTCEPTSANQTQPDTAKSAVANDFPSGSEK